MNTLNVILNQSDSNQQENIKSEMESFDLQEQTPSSSSPNSRGKKKRVSANQTCSSGPAIKSQRLSTPQLIQNSVFKRDGNGVLTVQRINDFEIFIRWQIKDFKTQYLMSDTQFFYSDELSIKPNLAPVFEMYYDPVNEDTWSGSCYGILLKRYGRAKNIAYDIDLWMENKNGVRFNVKSEMNVKFKDPGEGRGPYVINDGYDGQLLANIWDNHEDLYTCCRLSVSNKKLKATKKPNHLTNSSHQTQQPLRPNSSRSESNYHVAVETPIETIPTTLSNIKKSGSPRQGARNRLSTQPSTYQAITTNEPMKSRFNKERNGNLEIQDIPNGHLYRWQIPNFYEQFIKANKREFYSDTFSFSSTPNAKFSFFYNPSSKEYWDQNVYGVTLKKINNAETFDLNIEIWLENRQGEKFEVDSNESGTFDSVGQKWEFFVDPDGNAPTLLNQICNNREDLWICCKLKQLTGSISNFPTDPSHNTFDRTNEPMISSNSINEENPTNLSNLNTTVQNSHPSAPSQTSNMVQVENDELRQSLWAAYQNGQHDSVIKIGNSKFKVMKFLFTCRSTKFEALFRSTNTIQISDISVETMQSLVKWIYTGQIGNMDMIDDLFTAANTYEINSLKNYCLQHMSISLNNVLFLLAEAIKQNDDGLKSRALECIKRMSPKEMFQATSNPKWITFKTKEVELTAKVDKLIFEAL